MTDAPNQKEPPRDNVVALPSPDEATEQRGEGARNLAPWALLAAAVLAGVVFVPTLLYTGQDSEAPNAPVVDKALEQKPSVSGDWLSDNKEEVVEEEESDEVAASAPEPATVTPTTEVPRSPGYVAPQQQPRGPRAAVASSKDASFKDARNANLAGKKLAANEARAAKPAPISPTAKADKRAPEPEPGEVRRDDLEPVDDNPFLTVASKPLSTFSIDVDTASYSNVRRYLKRHVAPPRDAVRIEEMINYFDYDYAPPSGGEAPFAVHVETASSPWSPENRLVRIGLKGRVVEAEQRPVSNLVFLLDVSGSMSAQNKLPLLKQSLGMLLERLGEKDRVAIVVYAGASGLALPSTSCAERATIMRAMDNLQAGGSTNGAAGIELAYQVAVENFIEGGTNRVILATDGDFNVGTSSRSALTTMIEQKAKSGVFLSVLGFGMSHNDGTLEKLADKGNGNYAFIDTASEARKVLVEQLSGTLVTIAKDVKIQVEFNPAHVASYRLVGYNNRLLAARDFNDDTKDAGEIGAGHAVTAIYEIVPTRAATSEKTGVDPLKYQAKPRLTPAADSLELLNLKLRYKQPDGHTSALLQFPVSDSGERLEAASADMKFAVAVASFGQLLRRSPHAGDVGLSEVLALARQGQGQDRHGYRAEFMQLVQNARGVLR
ncbi:MAG: hypothetical protein CMH57_08970 [Myxococcales bacterium]|nr:hypothetical protein [Myxococcales bacterium]